MADPLAIELANSFRESLAARNQAAMLEMAQVWRGVELRLSSEFSIITEALSRSPLPTQARLLQQDRYIQLLAQVQTQLNGYNQAVIPGLEGFINGAAQQGLSDASSMLGVSALDQGVILGSFSTLDTAAVESLTAIALAGKPLNEILERSYPLAAQAMTSELIEGLAIGLGPRQIAARMMAQGLSQSFNHTLLVARDQINRSYRTATIEQYKTSGIVRGYYRVASKSRRTCPGCLALDGQFFELTEPFAEHPQGRCVAVPGLKNGKPLKFETGRQWIAKQPADVQRDILGPGRYDAWKAGLFDFDDLATIKPNRIWGPSVQPTTLKALSGLTMKVKPPGKFESIGDVKRWLAEQDNIHWDMTGATAADVARVNALMNQATRVSKSLPELELDFRKMHIDAVIPTLDEFEKLATQYPQYVDKLRHFGSRGATSNMPYDWDTALAHANHTLMGFNPKYYENAQNIIYQKRLARQTGWTVGSEHVADDIMLRTLVRHEFGHVIDAHMKWIEAEGLTHVFKYQNFAGGLSKADIRLKFFERNKPRKSLSEYSMATVQESFAEAFAAMEYGTAAQKKTVFVKRFTKFFEIMTNPGINLGDVIWTPDIRDMDEKDRAIKELSDFRDELSKALNIKF